MVSYGDLTGAEYGSWKEEVATDIAIFFRDNFCYLSALEAPLRDIQAMVSWLLHKMRTVQKE